MKIIMPLIVIASFTPVYANAQVYSTYGESGWVNFAASPATPTMPAVKIDFSLKKRSNVVYLSTVSVDISSCVNYPELPGCNRNGGQASLTLKIKKKSTGELVSSYSGGIYNGLMFANQSGATRGSITGQITSTIQKSFGPFDPGDYEASAEIKNVTAYNLKARRGEQTLMVFPTE